jgi:hypothetical protein
MAVRQSACTPGQRTTIRVSARTPGRNRAPAGAVTHTTRVPRFGASAQTLPRTSPERRFDAIAPEFGLAREVQDAAGALEQACLASASDAAIERHLRDMPTQLAFVIDDLRLIAPPPG